MQQFFSYIPILTTILSAWFLIELVPHAFEKKRTYLFWWAFGVLTFGLGTLAESVHAFMGWQETNFRFWYIVGALLGGFPLAQGSVYLLLPRKFGHATTLILSTFLLVAMYMVWAAPLVIPSDFDGRLSGQIFGWQEVRYFSPVLNLYAFIFLVGGAIYSARQYYAKGLREAPFLGNIYIAIGGLLPGIGGSFTRAGWVEVLFVTELLGLLLIFYGYRLIRRSRIATLTRG
jgi:hypothetical protein